MEKLYTRLIDQEARHMRGQGEDSETLLSDNGSGSQEPLTYHSPSRRSRLPYWAKAFLAVVSVILCLLLGALLGSHYPLNLDDTCTRHVQRYGPIMEDVPITYHTERFNGSLLKENAFRKAASPEVDEAWESLGTNYRSVVVPAELAPAAGLLPDQVKVNQKYGGGYPANVEGLHHLHCLNLLRKALYYNYDYYHELGEGPFKNDDNVVRYHVTHCLDVIRQQLMCTVDVGVLGQVWWNRDAPEAYVDFNTKHTCRNFDAVREWAKEHQAPAQVPHDYLEPPKPGDTIYAKIP